MPPERTGPREPWRTLGTPVVLAAVAVVGGAALLGIALLETFARVGELWLRRERWLLALAMGGLAMLVAAQAFGQHAGLPFTWTEEVSTLLVALVVWLGLAGLCGDGDLLQLQAGPIARHRAARVLARLATVIFFALVFALLWRAMPGWGLRTPALSLPRVLVWMLLPLGLFLALCVALHRASSGGRHEL